MISVRGLKKVYGAIPALENLDLEIPTGQFVALFGPNGAGKTTLVNILSTLLLPTDGTVAIGGFDLKRQANDIRKLLGVISHYPWLYSRLSAKENLMFYGRMYGIGSLEEQVDRRLSDVGMDSWADETVDRFSRGMQQRLAIARTLLHDPPVLLLDEPYTGLDRHAAKMLTNSLAALRSEKRTILLVTHDLSQGLAQAHRAMILRSGRIVEDSQVDELDFDEFTAKYDSIIGG